MMSQKRSAALALTSPLPSLSPIPLCARSHLEELEALLKEDVPQSAPCAFWFPLPSPLTSPFALTHSTRLPFSCLHAVGRAGGAAEGGRAG